MVAEGKDKLKKEFLEDEIDLMCVGGAGVWCVCVCGNYHASFLIEGRRHDNWIQNTEKRISLVQ